MPKCDFDKILNMSLGGMILQALLPVVTGRSVLAWRNNSVISPWS